MWLIIAVVWMCGTGKSEVVSFLESKNDFYKVYFGGIVLEEVIKRYGTLTPEFERIVREDMRAEHGFAAIAHLALPAIQQWIASWKNILIDGLYSFSEWVVLRDLFGEQFVTLAVHAPKQMRYERMATRDHRPFTKEEVDRRDFTEVSFIEKWWPIAVADWHVVNDGTLEELYARLAQVLGEIEEK
jgi:dephospho-CoA kinase